jgi:hypothetical protein
MPEDRSTTSYRIAFVPEAGLDAVLHVIADEVRGSDEVVDRAWRELRRLYDEGEWLERDSGYRHIIRENVRNLRAFSDGDLYTVSLSVPHGAIVIC